MLKKVLTFFIASIVMSSLPFNVEASTNKQATQKTQKNQKVAKKQTVGKKVTTKKNVAKKTERKIPNKQLAQKSNNKKSVNKKIKQVVKNSKSTTSKQLVASKSKDKVKPSYRSVSQRSANKIKYAVFNYQNGKVYEANLENTIWPIASLTKLMTAHVFIKNHPDLDNCQAEITSEDVDRIKNTSTKLAFNKPYSCKKLLEVMLIASDNYAASALARAIPGWSKQKFIYNMNKQAREWHMNNTYFHDSSGLSAYNKSSILDYKNLTMEIVKNPIISDFSTSQITYAKNRANNTIQYRNSNRLIRDYGFNTELSKTGYIRESGYNLVHLADCQNNIGVIEFGATSSMQRSNFVKEKLSKYGCSY